MGNSPKRTKRITGSSILKLDSILYPPRQPVRRLCSRSESFREGGWLMSTYEEFMVILTAGLLIVAILNMKNK